MSRKRSEIMGIDVGGTKILLQTFDRKMRVVEEAKVLTQTKKGEKGFTDQLICLIERHFNSGIKAIGIAVPGIVNYHTGTLVKAPHLPTRKNYPLKKFIEDRFKRPVYVDNDINAFLWAEKERPQLKKRRNIVAVMVGTGLGGAILNEGKLVYGASGYAGEVGHMIINQHGPLKTLEQNTSGSYLAKISGMLKAKGKDANGPKVKKYILEQLGIGLSNLHLIFNPEVFVLGGSIYHYYLAKKKKKLERIIAGKSLDGRSPKIVDAGRNTSVALGAAMMAMENVS
ncbi:ROK family protein [Patescibacteria group bacterium]|nr:ROK family protein [Patescibacteria group bacterium]MBU1015561.1 ROK family protein [Patescibacteria group bacterium]MBU1685612.1 ROK family protein [Patescibacteria group bacterium]MBU1938970.1 ROK family protein [Patescibacteria group bacterium]